MGADDFSRRARGKRIRSREQLVQRDAERVEIGSRPGGRALEHLGRRVLEAAARDRLDIGEAQVHQERAPLSGRAREHGVLRLHVAMDDPPAVQVPQGARDFRDVSHHRDFGGSSEGREVLGPVLQGERRSAGVVPERHGTRQVRMGEDRRPAIFGSEPRRRPQLERDLLPGE